MLIVDQKSIANVRRLTCTKIDRHGEA